MEQTEPAAPSRGLFGKLKHPSQFSKPQLAIFIIAFGLIGYLIYTSFATSPVVATLQAEQMSLPTGAHVYSDSTASGGKYAAIDQTGTATGSVNFPSSVTSMTIVAKGSNCNGWPWMKVSIDGVKVYGGYANTTSWSSYSVNFASAYPAGTHTLAIDFTNDAYSKGVCDKNLYVDATNFYGQSAPASAPTVALSASPSSVSAGQSSTLTWNSANANSCMASDAWSGSQPTSGSVSTGAINQNSTYTLSCTGPGGTATATATVTVSSSGGGGGGGGGGTTSYDQAISYTQTRPSFTPLRTIDVTTAAQFISALSGLQAGDLVKATASFTVPGDTVFSKQLSSPAVIDLSGATVTFDYTGTADENAVYVKNASNLRIYGGVITDPNGGTCLDFHGSNHVLWWGFKVSGCGGSGATFLTAPDGGDFYNNDIQGEITDVGHHLAYDPHTEKGTGFHCAGENWDAQSNFSYYNNRLAFYCHDIAVGAAFPIGHDAGTFDHPSTGNVLYLKAVNLTCVAKIQTCGNGIELWSYTSSLGLDVKYAEFDNITGYPLFGNPISSGQNAKGVTLEYGRATNVMTNTYPKGAQMWDTSHGETVQNVQPAK